VKTRALRCTTERSLNAPTTNATPETSANAAISPMIAASVIGGASNGKQPRDDAQRAERDCPTPWHARLFCMTRRRCRDAVNVSHQTPSRPRTSGRAPDIEERRDANATPTRPAKSSTHQCFIIAFNSKRLYDLDAAGKQGPERDSPVRMRRRNRGAGRGCRCPHETEHTAQHERPPGCGWYTALRSPSTAVAIDFSM